MGKPVLPNLYGKVPREVQIAIKRIADHNDALEQQIAVLKGSVAARPAPLTLQQINAALSSTGSTPLNLTGLAGTRVVVKAGVPVVVPPTPPPTPPPGTCNTSYANSQPGGLPAKPNKRWMRGNFSGHVVPGAGFVPGGSTTPVDQVLTYFLDRYSPSIQTLILNNYIQTGFTHFQLSWPDSRSGNGQSVAQFVQTCLKVKATGLYTIVFLLSKVYDPFNMNGAEVAPIVDPVITALNAAGAADIYCVGWELNLFNDPGTAGGPLAPFQDLINHIAAEVVPTSPLYVHFSPGVIAWQPNGDPTSAFWNANIGQLTGLLFQQNRTESPDCPSLQARLADTQTRFGGADGFSSDSGFGHPWDIVAFEQGANDEFFGVITEAQGDALGLQAIQSPIPSPGVPVMGYMNGCTGVP